MPAPLPPHRAPHPLATAQPIRTLFDPYNSSSTGHQRADNRLAGSTSWRTSRALKLGEQFKDGQRGGGKRVSDTVGAGSAGFGTDGRLANGGWERGASGLRTRGQRSLFECFGEGGVKVGKAGAGALTSAGHGNRHAGKQLDAPEDARILQLGRIADGYDDGAPPSTQPRPSHNDIIDDESDNDNDNATLNPHSPLQLPAAPSPRASPQIFRNLTIYVNGSTFPTISDHKLKRELAAHGAALSISLGRRTVTHVILGAPGHAGGGGLASGKMQREIGNVRGKGVKFVGVEWVVQSVRAGRRLPEAAFEVVRLAGRGQESVWGAIGGRAGGVAEGDVIGCAGLGDGAK